MSIVLKTIGKKKYAYTAYRVGRKVIHKYLGPASDENIASEIERRRSEKRLPEKLRRLFWDVDADKVNLSANARYIIERILENGDMDAYEWMQRVYPARLIIDVCETSRKISPKAKNFWKIWYGT